MVQRNKKIDVTDISLELVEPHSVTVEDIARQLDEDRDLAHRLGKPGAAIHATMGMAKLYGLISSQAEIADLRPEPEPKKYSDLEIARRLGFILARGAHELDVLNAIEKKHIKSS